MNCSGHITICLPLEFILEMQQLFSHCATSKISLGTKKQTNVFPVLPSGKTSQHGQVALSAAQAHSTVLNLSSVSKYLIFFLTVLYIDHWLIYKVVH